MWIEILDIARCNAFPAVTPLAGVWIEMLKVWLPFWIFYVTPLAGVWIEISLVIVLYLLRCGHSPCGSVD